LRLAIELAVLAGGAAGVAIAGRWAFSAGLAALIVVHYAVAWARVRWLLEV
jgi:hypothetical protein